MGGGKVQGEAVVVKAGGGGEREWDSGGKD